MDIDKLRCIATVWAYILPIIILCSYLIVMLVKEMVSDEQSSDYWTIYSDTFWNNDVFK